MGLRQTYKEFIDMTPEIPPKNFTPHLPEDYDARISSVLPYYSSFHQETINLVKSLPSSPKIWMDTGCGTGSLINKSIEEFLDTKFLLLDPSESMLEQAKGKLSFYPDEGGVPEGFLHPGIFSGTGRKAGRYHCHTMPPLSQPGRPFPSHQSVL